MRWTDHGKECVPCDDKDKQLFAACTKITLGNGKRASFWTDKWLNGIAPADETPLLFQLATRKSLTMAKALHNGIWLRSIKRISNEEELHQILQLWIKIEGVQLTEEDDSIQWLPCANGQYSAKSAYE